MEMMARPNQVRRRGRSSI